MASFFQSLSYFSLKTTDHSSYFTINDRHVIIQPDDYNPKDFSWIKLKKEFLLKGVLYDIVVQNYSNNKMQWLCKQDVLEENMVSNLLEFLEEDNVDNKVTSLFKKLIKNLNTQIYSMPLIPTYNTFENLSVLKSYFFYILPMNINWSRIQIPPPRF